VPLPLGWCSIVCDGVRMGDCERGWGGWDKREFAMYARLLVLVFKGDDGRMLTIVHRNDRRHGRRRALLGFDTFG